MSLRSAAQAAKNAHPFARSFTWLRKTIKENGRLKLLSIGLAFLLFAVSRQPSRDVMMVDVPLEFVNIPRELEISSPVPSAVNVRLRGPRDVVTSISSTELEVTADLSNKNAGDRVIQLKPSDVRLPDKIEVRRIDPQSIELKLEHTRQKTVPIEVHFTGNLPVGFELKSFILDPAAVEIEGPESRVNNVSNLATESVRLDGRQGSFATVVDLETGKHGVRIRSQSQIKLNVEILPIPKAEEQKPDDKKSDNKK